MPRAPTRHLDLGALVVDGLAGEGVHPDLGHGHRGVLQLAVEPQNLGPLTGVLHHLGGGGGGGGRERQTDTESQRERGETEKRKGKKTGYGKRR